MSKFLMSACAAAMIGVAAAPATAGELTIFGSVQPGAIIQAHDDGYYRGGPYDDYGQRYPRPGYGDDWRNPAPGYGWGWDWNRQRTRDRDWGWGNGWGNGGYGNYGVVPPRWIVRNLARHHYSYITRPVLAGRYYQVKAIDPRGRKVKLYIDAYTGEIAKRKFRG